MSHELRTPLNAILGYTQIFRNDPELMTQHGQPIDTIHRSGEHLLMIINEVLDLSKIEAGKLELSASVLHLPHMVKEIGEMVRLRAEGKDLTFELSIGDNLPTGVKCDEKRLSQVLLNLLSNAVKFTTEGGVWFSVAQVSQTTAPDGNGWHDLRFSVTDSGPGIAQEDLDAIFKPFHQVGNLKARAEGTGLGLAISRRLVDMMGGELKVSSELGQGSEFWFTLSLEEAAAPEMETISIQVPKGYVGPRRRVLVVDDTEHNRAVVKGMLRPLGFEIVQAENGIEGLNAVMEKTPNIMLVDLMMPEMDGYEFVKRIRANPQWRRIPVIAISASVDPKTIRKTTLQGFDAFLKKPLYYQELLGVLGKYLNLQWEYREGRKEKEDVPEGDLVLPSRESLEALLDAAQKNQYGRLKKVLITLQEDAALSVFAGKVETHLKGFQFKPIVALVESCLAQKSR